MEIGGYLKTSFIEWPGKISSVIFTSGCNFRCPFCHNRDLVDPSKMRGLKKINEKSVLLDLKKRKKWIDGVVVTGGEPLIQPGLKAFLKKIKNLGFKTMIETNGSQPKELAKLLASGLKILDFLAMDYKTSFANYPMVVFPQSCRRKKNLPAIGRQIKKSIRLILKSGIDFELRTTIVPTIHSRTALIKMARDLKKLLTDDRQSAINWTLQSFRPKNCLEEKFNQLKPLSQEEIKDFLKPVKKIIPGAKLKFN